jgi:hypothetical protein
MQKKLRERRRIKLIKPRLQLKLIATFVGLAALAFLMQSMIVVLSLTQTAADIPEGGPYLMALLPGLPVQILLFSFGLLLPLIFAVGILVTFRIAGPVYRFEKFLQAVVRGDQIGPCKLRDGDELQELCDLINEATAPLRHGRRGEPVEAPAAVPAAEPAYRESA